MQRFSRHHSREVGISHAVEPPHLRLERYESLVSGRGPWLSGKVCVTSTLALAGLTNFRFLLPWILRVCGRGAPLPHFLSCFSTFVRGTFFGLLLLYVTIIMGVDEQFVGRQLPAFRL